MLRPLPDAQSRFASLQSGETDIVWADEFEADNILRAQKDRSCKVLAYVGSGAAVDAINTKVAPLDDVRVRQALVMAIDRKKMSQALTNGLARPASNPYGDGSWVKCKDDGALPYDPEKATALIKEYGKPVAFKMLFTATPRGRAIGQVLQQFWKQVGADMEIEQVDQATFPPRAFQRQFEITPWRIIDFPDPDLQMFANFHTGSPVALANYSNPELDKLLEHARVTPDEAKRTEDYCAISRLDQPGGDLVLDLPEHLLRHRQGQGEGHAEDVRRRHRRVGRLAGVAVPMLRLRRRRLLYLLPVLFAVTLLTFLIASLLPGDLAYVILGDQATPEKVAALRARWGSTCRSGSATSLAGGRAARRSRPLLPHRRDGAAAVADRLPVSLELMVLAEVVGLAIGIPLAILCAVKSGSAFDRFLTGLAFGKLSLPSFMLAILLIYLFAVELNWLPATGWVPFAEDPVGNLRSFVLPALTLAFAEWPVLMRVLRSDMIATLQEDYIAMAKAKGLQPARILLVHALKPSSLTLVTVTGINIGRLIGGALIVETIFALPGIGRLLVGAIYARDFIILQGVVLFVAAGFVVVNFIVDMLYAVLDPRIRHGRA